MHETSVVRALLDQVTEIVRREGGGTVETIRIEIGPLSGVEPVLVSSAFADLVSRSECSGSRLEIVETTLQVACRSCGATTELPDFRFRCRTCGARDVDVVRGDEVRLVDVTVASLDPTAEIAETSESVSFEGSADRTGTRNRR